MPSECERFSYHTRYLTRLPSVNSKTVRPGFHISNSSAMAIVGGHWNTKSFAYQRKLFGSLIIDNGS